LAANSSGPTKPAKERPAAQGDSAPDGDAEDIFRLLDQLEELPEKAKHLPMNTLVGFDHEQFYYLVLKVRANLPEEMKKAQRIARDADRIIDEAKEAAVQHLEHGRTEANRTLETGRNEAERIVERAKEDGNRLVEQARAHAAAMVEQSEIMQMAKAQAHEILRHAENEAAEIRKGADEYAKDVLVNLEAVIGKAMSTIQRGRESLNQVRVA
jgi:vacuolar-type H+-ATPase subunit H